MILGLRPLLVFFSRLFRLGLLTLTLGHFRGADQPVKDAHGSILLNLVVVVVVFSLGLGVIFLRVSAVQAGSGGDTSNGTDDAHAADDSRIVRRPASLIQRVSALLAGHLRVDVPDNIQVRIAGSPFYLLVRSMAGIHLTQECAEQVFGLPCGAFSRHRRAALRIPSLRRRRRVVSVPWRAGECRREEGGGEQTCVVQVGVKALVILVEEVFQERLLKVKGVQGSASGLGHGSLDGDGFGCSCCSSGSGSIRRLLDSSVSHVPSSFIAGHECGGGCRRRRRRRRPQGRRHDPPADEAARHFSGENDDPGEGERDGSQSVGRFSAGGQAEVRPAVRGRLRWLQG